MFRDLWERGYCLEQSMEQLYSEALGKFLADRFVVGTCPNCGYEVRCGSKRSLLPQGLVVWGRDQRAQHVPGANAWR